jgi:hypothetical protein
VCCKDRYPGVRGGFGEPVIIGEQGGEFRAEQPCCRQVDRIQGAQQPVRLDDGGADDVVVDLDILESMPSLYFTASRSTRLPGFTAGRIVYQNFYPNRPS